jgi:hypothetical protein
MQQQPIAAQLEVDFRAALNRIGFTPDEQGAIIEYTGCRNIAMLGLLSEDDITRMFKAFCTRPNAPMQLTVLQEKLQPKCPINLNYHRTGRSFPKQWKHT